MTETWTNDAAIERWGAIPREVLDDHEPEGDFSKRHLMNPILLRMLGDVSGKRILDAGCGSGYFSRMLADRGAEVVGVEPGRAMFEYALEKEAERRQGIRYVQADLARLPAPGGDAPAHSDVPTLGDMTGGVRGAGGDASVHEGAAGLDRPFDAVVSSMVLPAVPNWRAAMRACLDWLAPGGFFVFSVNHPCFENLFPVWREHGEYRTSRYLEEYELAGPYASDFHRPISAYVNQVIALGGRILEIAEPGLDPAVASNAEPGVESYIHLPNFLIVAAEKMEGT